MPGFSTEAALLGISHQVKLEIIWLLVKICRQRLGIHVEWLHQVRGHDNEKLCLILLILCCLVKIAFRVVAHLCQYES